MVTLGVRIGMRPTIQIDARGETPLYRQVYEQIKLAIQAGDLRPGARLPPTRELAGLLNLNRTTIAAAYELLESEGLIRGHVGRGSFVEGPKLQGERLDWDALLPAEESTAAPASRAGAAKISFASSRPSEALFPLDEFRATCREVIDSSEAAQILQLGPAGGYGRRGCGGTPGTRPCSGA